MMTRSNDEKCEESSGIPKKTKREKVVTREKFVNFIFFSMIIA